VLLIGVNRARIAEVGTADLASVSYEVVSNKGPGEGASGVRQSDTAAKPGLHVAC